MHLQSNPQLDLAYEYVRYTNENIFLTGKAGTGKTTFLHRIKEEVVKRMVVVAPTGVAAINAGGMTIHSFFQLPFGPYVPGKTREVNRQRKFSGKKIRLIRTVELLVIDEISMVRADLLDGVDEVLRRYKNPLQPFGGVQLLMIGDLHQLPPVVKGQEWDLLRTHYETPYFFSSQALQKTRPVVVELKHIYRQSDTTFIDLLNKVRDNEINQEILATLNSRYKPDVQVGEEDGYITLTTHNATAREINAKKLAELPGKTRIFHANITGDFPSHAYPTDEELELKTGAQVLFVRNDPSAEKRFFNGKIGKITRIEKDKIYVRCPGDEEEITVEPLEWENVKYSLDEQSKEVSEEVAGTFTQYPLKLAWAITIHKSQGLTFERVILDAQAAFAHGQVYVALSRCKSFEGIVLRSRINPSSVKTDLTVKKYSEAAEKNAPGPAELEQAKRTFQQSLIFELFGFQVLKKYFERMNRVLLEHERKMVPGSLKPFRALADKAKLEIFPVADKFRRQLRHLFREGGLPEENEVVQSRIRKGSAWFAEKMETVLKPAAKNIHIVTDNRKVRQTATEALENIQKEIFIKQACFVAAGPGFSTQGYQRAKAKAELDFKSLRYTFEPPAGATAVPDDAPHPELYAQILAWRAAVADEQGMKPYSVIPAKSLIELVRDLPVSKAGLKKITGIGKGRIKRFGADLIDLIEKYCEANDIESPSQLKLEKNKQPKPDTKSLSYALYLSGKSVKEIAKERSLVPSTIEGHLAHYIGRGELSVFELIEKPEVEKIEAFLEAHPEAPLSEVKTHFKDAYSYGEIKMVLAHREAEI
jgi:hypothetical protein